MKKLLIATRNQGKFKELAAILSGVPYEIVSVSDLKLEGEPIENGATYEENALIKARFFSGSGEVTLADDSGLEVSALKGELGLKTRRWGVGEGSSDEEWLGFFLKRMKGEKNRKAKFVCSAVLTGGGFSEMTFFAEVDGVITERPMSPLLPGLPLSSCFIPEGMSMVYAGLTREEKGKVSHRGLAVGKVRRFLIMNKKIEEMEKESAKENKYWICGKETGGFLMNMARKIGARNVLEFGTSVGYSALWLAASGAKVFTVESHKERGDIAERNFKEVAVEDGVTLVRGHAPEVLKSGVFDGVTFDMVFLDSTKYEYPSYFEAVKSRLNIGGVIVADNVVSHGGGNMIKKFLSDVKNDPAFESRIENIGNGLLVAIRKVGGVGAT
ncbi:MAG: RdgB/HAM1 family non-canonical purine NTP pyrophosphatase, dITP/XTP pyrophosphatase [Candidatus Peregrinibacteria bacterium GW2011_GWF2_43_17]|nr:MAG: RdgB/HAM1 family non-canonical purine NTP pyrophosphatase, dITP/XTP pyrophosphatase [Candidatus Peregrinibacteria bacterium GW2011_GWF2_43_17]HAU39564.1 hypothetical protein [Candidatus Peregrinibacteria bacterium]